LPAAGESLVSEQTRDERLQIMLTEEEFSALDDWRFAHRMPSRAAAVRELLRRGLQAEGVELSGRQKSKDYGVTTAHQADGAEG
jgi:hypothetical protein